MNKDIEQIKEEIAGWHKKVNETEFEDNDKKIVEECLRQYNWFFLRVQKAIEKESLKHKANLGIYSEKVVAERSVLPFVEWSRCLVNSRRAEMSKSIVNSPSFRFHLFQYLNNFKEYKNDK